MIIKPYTIIACTALIILTACSSAADNNSNEVSTNTDVSNTEQSNQSKIDQVINQSVYLLDLFTDIPAEIDGCSCLFSLDKEDWEKGNQYVFAGNLTDKGFIRDRWRKAITQIQL